MSNVSNLKTKKDLCSFSNFQGPIIQSFLCDNSIKVPSSELKQLRNYVCWVGSGCQNSQNFERNLHCRIPAAIGLGVEPYVIEIPKLDKRSGAFQLRKANVILPVDVAAALSENSCRFERVFGTPTEWERWWSVHSEEPWMRDHPDGAFIKANPQSCCPYLLFGDDAQTSKRCGSNVKKLASY